MTEVTDREIALQTKLAEMLCSKLCHDLISPIGAINNGLEFLQDADSGMADDAAILIGGSAKRAAQKLAYFRLAFGVGGSGDNMDITTVRSLIDELAVENKISTEWEGEEQRFTGAISKNFGKLMLNLALLAADCLPRGGLVTFSMPNFPQNLDAKVVISGDKCQMRDDIKSVLEPNLNPDDLTARNVISFFCKLLAKNNGKSLILRKKSPHLIEFEIS